MIQILDQGNVYRNSRPEMRAVHASLADHLPLSGKEILCVYRRGTALISADGRVAKTRSLDGGRTWTDEGIVWDGKNDDKQYDYRMPDLTRLSDGTLLMVCSRQDRSDPEKAMYSPETEGLLPFQIMVSRSEDGGRHWSQPIFVQMPSNVVGPHASHIMAPASGRLALTFDSWKPYDDPTPAKPKSYACYSEDGGVTWGDARMIQDGEADGRIYWDIRTASLGGDRILGLYWTHDPETDKDLMVHRTISEDGGLTWSKPAPTNLPGQISAPLHLGGARVLVTYNDRYGEQPGIYAATSEDEGKTWNIKEQVTLWDPMSERTVRPPAGDREMHHHVVIAFGMPCPRRLPGGDVFVTYWCTQACLAQIRWCRLRVE